MRHRAVGKDDLILGGPTEAFSVYNTGASFQKYSVRLSNEVEDQVAKYNDLLNFLDQASTSDIVSLHLSSYGGSVHTGFALCHALKNTAATTRVIVDASCYSMGSILALCGNQLILTPKSFLMFHNYSGEHNGKGGEMKVGLDRFQKYMYESLSYFCSPFLSKSEIKKIQNDQDVYIHAEDEDLKVRMKRHYKDSDGLQDLLEIF